MRTLPKHHFVIVLILPLLPSICINILEILKFHKRNVGEHSQFYRDKIEMQKSPISASILENFKMLKYETIFNQLVIIFSLGTWILFVQEKTIPGKATKNTHQINLS